MIRNKIIISICALLFTGSIKAQLISCDTNITVGQNLIINGGFEDGDTGFNMPGYNSWNTNRPSDRHWSVTGDYYVTDNANDFNPDAFSGSPNEGNLFLAVDGFCDPNIVVWEQTVYISKETRYFFSVDIASIHEKSPAVLSFEIGGVTLPKVISATSTKGEWQTFIDSSWYSAEQEGMVTIKLETHNLRDVQMVMILDWIISLSQLVVGLVLMEKSLY